MPLPTLILTHGRAQEWQVELTLKRDWEEALRSGLKRVGAPYWETIPVRFAYYAGPWRDDAEADRGDDDEVTPIQDEVARELVTRGAKAAADDLADDRSLFSTLTGLVGFVDEHVGIGGELVLQLFLKDLAQYFKDKTRRTQANRVLATEARAAKGDVILLGHSMGTIVSYLSLWEEQAALKRVRGLLTFGSPLGMDSIRHHVDAIVKGLPFPQPPRRWVNVFNDEDFATLIPHLAPIYRSTDGRAVEDVPAKGRPPTLRDAGRGHDPMIYLTSRGLAEHLRSLIDDEPPGGEAEAVAAAVEADEPIAGERAAPPWLDDPDAAVGGAGASAEPDDYLSGGGGRGVGGNGGGDGGRDFADRPTTRSFDAVAFERAAAARPAGPSYTTRAMPPSPPEGRATAARPSRGVAKARGRVERRPARPAPMMAAAPGAAAPAVARPTVDRTLSADFPPVIAPGDERDLLIAIAARAIFGGGQAVVSIERPVGDQHVQLRIGVYAPDFEVRDVTGEAVSVAMVTLDLDNPTERVDARFRLTAPKTRQAMDSSIWISVWRGNLPIGQLQLRTRIDPQHVAPVGEVKLSFSGAPDPDVVVVVADRSADVVGKGPFDFRVSREGQFIDLALGELRVTAYAWNAARDILDKYRAVNKLTDKQDRIDKVTSLGVELWWKLPDAFRRFYWEELHDSDVRSIAIYSQEPYIPWELIVPQRQLGSGRTEPMLGVAYSIARWKQGRHFPDPLVVEGMSVIAPDYPVGALPEAALEAADLVTGYGARPVVGTYKVVKKLLRTRGTQLIHFAGHGSYDPANVEDSEIRLSDRALVPGDLSGASIGLSDRPFVFLNACQVGETGWDLTQIGGWADAFCDIGFSGFVGPYWKVNDLVAHRAAGVFYGALRDGLTVGEAMQAIRRRFREDDKYPGHTSWLAYSLHCQPNVHVRLPGAP
jgi:CHAT domain-containing protein/PGAP1-like protein